MHTRMPLPPRVPLLPLRRVAGRGGGWLTMTTTFGELLPLPPLPTGSFPASPPACGALSLGECAALCLFRPLVRLDMQTDRDNVCAKNSLKDVAPQQTSVTQASPPSAADEDNFWDFKDSDSKKNDDKKKKEAPKGASKTLNKSQQDQFSKWCFGELAKLTGSDDTTLGEFATVFAGARGLARPCACTCAVE